MSATDLASLEKTIEAAFDNRDNVNTSTRGEVRDAVETALNLLDSGKVRVAAWAARNDVQRANLEAASIYYEEARKFARLCARYSAGFDFHEYVVVTGGGPGVMEAGNRGASEEGAPSIGLNIVLPHEQAPNVYVTPELSFNFHYFAIRKMHFMVRAKAIAVFPGGFGTLDELFECLTLIQTGRMERLPLILFGEKFWRDIINFDALAEFGTIAPDDVKLISFVDTADEAWKIVADFYEHDNGH